MEGAAWLKADVTRTDEVDAMVARAMEMWGRVDIGVNVVGGGGVNGRTVLETSDEEWQSGIEHNLYSAIRCCRAYAKAMISGAVAGSIVNVASARYGRLRGWPRTAPPRPRSSTSPGPWR